jgi:hypothetical protein
VPPLSAIVVLVAIHAKERRALSARGHAEVPGASRCRRSAGWARSLLPSGPPLTGQVLEAVGVEQRLVELAALEVAHLGERRIADELLDAAAQRGARGILPITHSGSHGEIT